MRATANRLLETYEIPVDPDETVGSLPNDLKKMVQIVKAVSLDPRILILDEPTSSLTEAQVRVALRLIRQLASQGVGLVLISHYLAEIFEVCDDLTVMRDGEVVYDGPVGATTLPQVVAAMVGRSVDTARRKARRRPRGRDPVDGGREPFRFRGFLQDISFTLRRGEVLGITGLAGSGLGELARAVFGASARKATGRVLMEGRPVPRGDPAASLEAGIALLTSDRLREGIFLDFTLTDNICLPILSRLGPLRRRCSTSPRWRRRRSATSSGSACARRAPFALARQLSGGNQQKVLFAKWLETRPKAFVMDEPTIGVDVGAKEEIRGIIDEIAAAGVGILLVTTELDELVLLCDRVLIMFRGAIVGELSGERVQREAILRASACGEIQAVEHDDVFHAQARRRSPAAPRLLASLKRSYSLIQALGCSRSSSSRCRSPTTVSSRRRTSAICWAR